MGRSVPVSEGLTHEWGFILFCAFFYNELWPNFIKILIFDERIYDLRSQIFFVIRVEGHNGGLHAKFEPLSQFLEPNIQPCTKFGVAKC